MSSELLEDREQTGHHLGVLLQEVGHHIFGELAHCLCTGFSHNELTIRREWVHFGLGDR